MQMVICIKEHLTVFLYQSSEEMDMSTSFRDYFELHSQIPFLSYKAELIAAIIKTDELAEFVPSSLAYVWSVRLRNSVLE